MLHVPCKWCSEILTHEHEIFLIALLLDHEDDYHPDKLLGNRMLGASQRITESRIARRKVEKMVNAIGD